MVTMDAHARQWHLPRLRQDIELLESHGDANGNPSWLLYDPLKNAFYRIGKKPLDILALWQNGREARAFLDMLLTEGIETTMEEIAGIARLITRNHLAETGSPQDVQRLEQEASGAESSWWRWLVTHYLYIRIPLLRPDAFLTRTLPLARPLLQKSTTVLFLLMGIIGLFLVSRQWEAFRSSLLHFFSWDGILWFALTLTVLKTIHELGHAYTAKELGCRVPSMGVAFLVLYPFLYTDTTDSWRLLSPRKRLRISFAGIRAEMGLAILATLFWSFLSDGYLRSAMFFVATAGWASTLIINLNPFMRFDGYYMLGDILGEENLQPRAFALGRWTLRELLFGFGAPLPENLTKQRHRILLIYAWSTWCYRFFLFLGIALLVYHIAFKALGILLFAAEIIWFIVLPVFHEIHAWWASRNQSNAGRVSFTLLLLLLLTSLFFLPWQSSLVVPAMYEAALVQEVYPPEDALIEHIAVQHGQKVQKGDLLVRLSSSALKNRLRQSEIRIGLLQTRINRHLVSEKDLQQIQVLLTQLATELTARAGYVERMEQLLLRAPVVGEICLKDNIAKGQWISHKTRLLTVVDGSSALARAYVPETELWRIDPGGIGRFLPSDGCGSPIRLKTKSVERTAINQLDARALASVNGGPVRVRPLPNGTLKPEKGWYRLELAPEKRSKGPNWSLPGSVRLEAKPVSPASHLWRFALGVLIRESSF